MISAHESWIVETSTSGYAGSPLYDVTTAHISVVASVVVLVLGVLFARNLAFFERARTRLRGLCIEHRTAVVVMVVSAAAHVGAAFGHEPSWFTGAYLLDASMLTWGARRLLFLGRSGLGVMALVASLLGVPISVAGGTVPDQVVMIVKTFELLGLLAVALPSRRHRLGVAATAFLAVVTSVAAFGSALSAGVSHHVGETPAAGMAMPVGVARQPTIEEAEAASDLAAATAAAIAEYEDVSVAASAGYDVADVWGVDHHADNPAYLDDGRILDPEHPETLVYGVDASGSPVLLGAMFQMPGVGVPGPMIGGPLTVWHAHEQVCVGVIPGLTVSLVSPFGMCPVGSFTVALTNEMIHVWTVTGAPDPFGDLDEDFRQEYLGLDGGGEP